MSGIGASGRSGLSPQGERVEELATLTRQEQEERLRLLLLALNRVRADGAHVAERVAASRRRIAEEEESVLRYQRLAAESPGEAERLEGLVAEERRGLEKVRHVERESASAKRTREVESLGARAAAGGPDGARALQELRDLFRTR